MKVRAGFVSNSSSSSFVITERTPEQLKELEELTMADNAVVMAKMAKMNEIRKTWAPLFSKDELFIIENALENLSDSMRHEDNGDDDPDDETRQYRLKIDDLLERFGMCRQVS